jgi:hypothetical protein
MKTRYLGCLSFSGLSAALITLLVVGGIALARGGVLFSPGALSAQTSQQRLGGGVGYNVLSHAEIAGNCKACHASPWSTETMADRCIACHTDLVQDPHNFHKVMLAQAQVSSCRACHPEHRGPTASLISMDLNQFPHNALGYSLTGHQKLQSGATFTCADCHGKDITHFDQAVCASCHQKIDATFMIGHVQAYAQDCLACHDGVDRFGSGFNHSKLAFPLQGKHTSLTCSQCHHGARAAADFKTAPQNCFGCHQKDDIHQGDLGQDCGSCHKPDGWSQASFDHTKSAFQLTGKHIQADCKSCHVPGADGKTIFKGTPATCYACHQKDDAHQGQFGQDCSSCHTPDDWKKATFDHSKAVFQLTGKHIQVACNACHVPGADGKPVFKGTPTTCYACHQKDDAHQGQFGQDCSACHTPDGWDQATFDHSKTAFPLTGAHLQVKCTQCHVNNVFKGLSTDCVACHADPTYHLGLFGAVCSTCHTTTAWSPAQFTGPHAFPMSHGGANSCRSCHPNNLATYTCYTCHDQAQTAAKHRGENITNLQNCVRCHPTGGGGG